MPSKKEKSDSNNIEMLDGKSDTVINLFNHFILEYNKIKPVEIYQTKSMIGIGTGERRVAWITQIGKNFIHVVIPFEKPYNDNLCFQKIAQVPGDDKQFNHHLRIYSSGDVNGEVKKFMKLSFDKKDQ